MGIANWLSIATQVASVSASVLPMITEALTKGANDEKGEESSEFMTGDVAWYPDPSLRVCASNMGAMETGLNYAQSDSDSSTSLYVTLPPGQYYDATDDLSYFKDGQLTVGQVETSTSAQPKGGGGDLTKAVSFCIKALSLGVSATIVKGVAISFNKASSGNFEAKVEFTGTSVKTAKADLTVVDTRGGSVSASGETTFTTPTATADSGVQQWTISLPTGVDLDPLVQRVDLRLEMDTEAYERATAESRQRAKKGRPARARRAPATAQ